MIGQIMAHYARKILLPAPFRAVYTGVKSIGYIWKGIQTLAQRKLEVPVLDATAWTCCIYPFCNVSKWRFSGSGWLVFFYFW